jgi:homoserine O-acetyltransferase
MMRRMLIDAIRNDPGWNNGDYTTQPRALQVANVFYGIATSGGSQAYHKLAPTREQADRLLDARLAAPFTADANDFLYQWDASRDYNPAPDLDRIRGAARHQLSRRRAQSARAGIMEREPKRIKNARLYLIPASADARARHHGHGEAVEAAAAGSAADDARRIAIRPHRPYQAPTGASRSAELPEPCARRG